VSEFDRVTLKNGQRAIRHLPSGEVMHPAVGPWEEANLLYVRQLRLAERLSRPGPALRIYDVGLGAATNAVAAIAAAQALGPARVRELEVVSFERDLDPLRIALGDPEGFPYLVPFRALVESLAAGQAVEARGLRWTLQLGDVREELERAPGPVDLVYFDPFSPKANPELWTVEAFSHLRRSLKPVEEGTVLVTYSGSTRTRVSLLLAGFFVGVGLPVGAKRETTLASTRLEALETPLDRRFLERWRRSSAQAPHGEALPADLEARLAAHPQLRG
jgi:tRNA U34 5-methylaminomethyl-2-thiouridine-forming methyltransferase MnmC